MRFPDFSNQLHSITQTSAQWTATQDCWLQGIVRGANNSAGLVYVNGISVGGVYVENASDCLVAVFVPVKAGAVISTRNVGTYDLKVYGCA